MKKIIFVLIVMIITTGNFAFGENEGEDIFVDSIHVDSSYFRGIYMGIPFIFLKRAEKQFYREDTAIEVNIFSGKKVLVPRRVEIVTEETKPFVQLLFPLWNMSDDEINIFVKNKKVVKDLSSEFSFWKPNVYSKSYLLKKNNFEEYEIVLGPKEPEINIFFFPFITFIFFAFFALLFKGTYLIKKKKDKLGGSILLLIALIFLTFIVFLSYFISPMIWFNLTNITIFFLCLFFFIFSKKKKDSTEKYV